MSIPAEETIDVLAEIREELEELPFIRAELEELVEITETLKRIAASVESWHAGKRPVEIVHAVPAEMQERLMRALGHVRGVLDCEGDVEPGRALPVNARARLFDVEAILSAELGQPVWDSPFRPEGRRT